MGEYSRPGANRFLTKVELFWWQLMLLLLFSRPLICEQAYGAAGFWYLVVFVVFCSIFIWLNIRKVIFSSALNCFVLLFMAAMIVSVFFSRQPLYSFSRVVLYLSNILVFFLVSSLSDKRKVQVIRIIVLSGILVACYALYQYFFGFRHLHDFLLRHTSYITDNLYFKMLARKRVYSTFCSPNLLATYLLMMLFVVSGLLMGASREKGARENSMRDLSLLGVLILLLGALFFTHSLGAILALSITFVIYVLFRVLYLASRQGSKWLNLRSLVFLLFFGVLILVMLKFNEARIAQLFNWGDPSSSFFQRLCYWKAGLKIAKDYFFTGIGWRQFGFYYEVYRPEIASPSQFAHSVFLQVTAEMGLYGLLTFLGVVACVMQVGFDKKVIGQQGLQLGLFLAAVVFLVHNCMDVSFYFGQTAFLWWAILGLLNENTE